MGQPLRTAPMKRLLSLSLLLVALMGVSCERQEFEGPNGTKQLHEHHGSHHGEEHEGEEGGKAHH
jgi:hypothetical protein